MKKFIGAALLVGAAMAGTTGVASAEGSLSGNVAFTSDYVWRGISQSGNDFAVQGGFDYSNGIFYAGTWASSVDFGTSGNTELDLYAGVKPELGPVALDFAVLGYFYPGSTDAGGDLDFYELKGGASFSPLDPLTLSATVYYSDDFGTFDEVGLYGEVAAGFALTESFSLSAAYGNQDVENVGSYNTYRAGASFAAHGFGFGATYTTTDGAEGFGSESATDDKIVFSVSRAL
ncbi:MAG: TorF family putative porin [Terricaulis sp.]